MTPKSLLRHKLAVSPVEDLVSGKFHNIIPEVDDLADKDVKRVVLCSGKVYYDLLIKRRSNQQKEVAIVRLEQLYPFPHDDLKAELAKYPNAKEIVWCQEEPKNQGAWFSSQHHMRSILEDSQELRYVGRNFFAAPAVGSVGLHNEQQQMLVDEALDGLN
jgi:2-oxoglutarate dehydrogenase E1 component